MKNETVFISEGYSMNYLIPGSFIILAGTILLAIGRLETFLVIPIGILLLLFQTGVEVTADGKIRSYKKLFNQRVGDFYVLNDDSMPILVHSKSAAYMHSRGSSTKVRQQSFELMIMLNGQQFRIHEFNDYRLARKCTNAITKTTNIKVRDDYGKKLSKSRSKPKRRNRHARNNV